MGNTPGWYLKALVNLGPIGFGRRAAYRLFAKRRHEQAGVAYGRLYTLTSRHSRHALFARNGSSDSAVFDQIFIDREYRCLDDVKNVELIIDCGANVGYSAAYFLSRHPKARVVSLEPDPDNAALLRKNLTPFGERSVVIEKGVWSHSTGLVFDERYAGAGAEWARRMRPARTGETSLIEAMGIAELLDELGAERVSILKIDIEGAEADVFTNGAEAWLGRVDHLVIELHGDACHDAFFSAIAGFDFEVSVCDELTVCKRPKRSARQSGEMAQK